MTDKKEEDPEKGGLEEYDILSTDEYILNDIEKNFILAGERGDLQGIKQIIKDNKDQPDKFNINCVDPLNRSVLISAIENENFDLITLLLEEGVQVGDALLHAISEEYVEAVEELLQWEEQNHKEGTPYSWEAIDRSKATFTSDITPLILAAHRNNYEILKILLDRGATLPMPHDVKCGCDDCVTSQESDSLRHSQSRINAYRALSASSLISLSSRDPVLTAFELSWELKRLQAMESEFRAEYTEMRMNVQEFVTSLLDHARTSTELEVMLNFNHEPTHDIWAPGQRQTLERLKLAIKYKQKTFVAHPNVQQLLAAIWYDGLPGFRRKQASQQIMEVIKLGCMFPLNSMNYIMAPESDNAKVMKKPFIKFISHSCSYMVFLTLLAAASLRVIQITFELIAFPWMTAMLDDWKKHERGSLPGPIELGIIMYIFSLIFGELKTLYSDGLFEYITDLWNIVDFISNMFYVTWILCRATAWVIVHRKSLEKAQALHDKVMKLLIRRFVTAEQRKRDDFGITEDDIIEVRQDISSLRFELLEIFQNNRFDVPDIDKKTAAAAGTKKGKVMERRILKDFQIGFVENLAQEMTAEQGGSKDIFSSIAKVIGKKGQSMKGEKKDWNAMARKNTMSSDPIGSKRSSMQRHSQRSLRRKIIEEANEGLKMSQNQLVQYNPALGEYTRATRVAYVKFMKSKMAADEVAEAAAKKEAGTSKEGSAASMKKTDKPAAGGDTLKSAAMSFKKKTGTVAADPTKPVGAPPKSAAVAADPTKPVGAAAKTAAADPTKPVGGAPPKPAGDAAKPGPPAKPGDSAAKPDVAKPGAATKPEAAAKKEEATKTDAAKPAAAGAAEATKGPAPAVPTGAKPDKPPAGGEAKPPADAPKATKAADTPSGSGDAAKPSGSDAAKPAAGGDAAKPAAKPAEAKKPAPQAKYKVGESSAAAGGDRGKSTVTGRMISGWL